MKIPAANIVIGFSMEPMKKLFAQGATFKSLVEGISSDKDVLLFNSESNPNFISFEHVFNLGVGVRMRLEIIDPLQVFERRFFTDNVMRNVAGWSHQKIGPDEPVLLYGDETEEFYSKFATAYKKEFGNKEIFIAYGVGNNLDLWAGPHRVVLTAADVTVKGARKLTLDFAPTPYALDIKNRRGAYNEVVNLNLAGLVMRYKGISQSINISSAALWSLGGRMGAAAPAYDPSEYLKLGMEDRTPDRLGGNFEVLRSGIVKALTIAGHGEYSKLIGEFDFHAIIVDTIRSYIQNATSNPNVIVLLPNMNIICRQIIKILHKKNQEGEESGQSLTVKRFMFYKAFLEHFGLELYYGGSLVNDILPSGRAGELQEAERSRDAAAAETDFARNSAYSVLEESDTEGIPDHEKALKDIINKINESAKGEYQIQWVKLTETDINILDFWSNGIEADLNPSNHYTFGGYNDFNEEQEAIIVGDLALIQNYLYGREDIQVAYDRQEEVSKMSEEILTDAERRGDLPPRPLVANGYVWPERGLALPATEAQQALHQKQAAARDVLAMAGSKTIPLHPLDQVILGNSVYNKNINNMVYPDITKDKVGPFGSISNVPDEFAYSHVDDVFKKEGFAKDIFKKVPVFLFNTQNPNILDMNFKFAPIYLALLKAGFQKDINRRAAAGVEGVLSTGIGSFALRTPGASVAYAILQGYMHGTPEKRKEILETVRNRYEITGKLGKGVYVSNAQDAVDLIKATLNDTEQTEFKGIVELKQLLPGGPQDALLDFTEDLYRKALQMNIKTLPIFHLSKVPTIGTPCVVFAQDAPIKQSIKSERSLLNTFFSGVYKIMGFKHTINSGSLQSEFKLVKNVPDYGVPPEPPPPSSVLRSQNVPVMAPLGGW